MKSLKEKLKDKSFWGKVLLLGGTFLTGAVTGVETIKEVITLVFM